VLDVFHRGRLAGIAWDDIRGKDHMADATWHNVCTIGFRRSQSPADGRGG
jgi:hypothetical protein